MTQSSALRGRITALALLAGAAGLDPVAVLGPAARSAVGAMLAAGQLELLAPGRVRLVRL